MRRMKCSADGCDGHHIVESRCHYCDQPPKARGLCVSHYNKAHYICSQRTLPTYHVLTPEDVRAIRRLSASGVTQYELAARFGVTQASVSKVVRRKTWRNVG
ncbi:hypothetical protein BN975_00341 [Mycolicibacterium farcinogenes]|nr:putative DNA-binding protein (UPF0251 family) [Mycolicibacterium senegalense]CDP82291.1 hypothetical protein BN975_00341 [Mycolicibacterium farcinogenes]